MSLLTVLMPVYNGERFLVQAIESVLAQTFADFKFLIIDDGSHDRSSEIIGSFQDRRIEYVRNDTNVGLTRTLNKGLDLISTRYVARMDQDDLSDPVRFEDQVRHLESRSETAVLGTWFHVIDNEGKVLYDFCPPTSHAEIVNCFVNYNPFGHSSLCMRTGIIKKYGGYPDNYTYTQDFGLLINVARFHEVHILDKPLVSIRSHERQTIHKVSTQLQTSLEVIRSTRMALASFNYDAVHKLRGCLMIWLYQTRIMAIRLRLFGAFQAVIYGIRNYLFHSGRAPLKIMRPWRRV